MTEEEAKTKLCCGAPAIVEAKMRIAGLLAPAAWAPFTCVASGCTAWRWNEPWTSQTEEGVGGDIVIRLARKPGEPKLGFCGLAGRPE